MLIFLSCSIMFMLRTDMNIAIVAMVKRGEISVQFSNVSDCLDGELNPETNVTGNCSPVTDDRDTTDENRLNWDEQQQNMVLGAIFWLYWASQVPGGMLAQSYGGKRVLGLSFLVVCVTTLLIPAAAVIDYRVLVALRAVQGLCVGVYRPSVNQVISRWVPPDERSKFLSSFVGLSVGALVTTPITGVIIHYINWQAVFYISGSIGLGWLALWWLLVYDDPSEDPGITQTELAFIKESLGDTVSRKKIGLLSGLPHLFRLQIGLLVAYLCDYLRGSKEWSATDVRKLATVMTNTVQGMLVLGLAFSSGDSVAAAICFAAALAVSGADSSAHVATFMDLSPNFCGVLTGIGNMVCVTPGFISAAVVGYITYQSQTADQWQKVFLVTAAMPLSTGVLHLFASSAELQDWNSPGSDHRTRHPDADEEAKRRLTTGM